MGSLCSRPIESSLKPASTKEISKIVRSRSPSYCDSPPNIRDYYKLGRVIGSGQFGKVRKATSLLDNKYIVAVKTIERRKIKNLDTLMREIQMLRLLDHPNIVKIYEVFEDEQAYHIVMELCTGRELLECLSDFGHLDEITASKVFKKILSIVNYLHLNGVCHRDLKLENFVGITRENETDLKLIDFGLSRLFFKGKNFMTTIVGTPYYVAPEVLSGKYGEKCDLWSCGVILHMLLSGTMPFNGWDQEDLVRNVQTAPVKFFDEMWNGVSDLAKDLVLQLLNRDINLRPSAEEALKHPWFNQNSPIPIDPRVILSLQDFRLKNSFHKEVLLVLAKTLNYSQTKELNQAFDALDTQKAGYLNEDDIRMGLEKVGLNPVKSELKECLRNLDLNKDGKINYSEFLLAALNSWFVLDEENIKEVFSHFDQGTGKIGKSELKQVLTMNNSSIEDPEKILDELDLKNKGQISYPEFKKILLSY